MADFDCSAVAFYDFRSTAAKRASLYKLILDWFASLDCVPDRMGLDGKGFSQYVMGYEKQQQRLAKRGFRDLRGFGLYSVGPAFEDQTEGIQVSACFVFDERPNWGYVVGQREIVSLPRLHQTIGCNVVRLMKPSYGIGYYRPFSLGPQYYAMGLSKGLKLSGPSYEEGLAIARWCDIGMDEKVYNKGLLRDLYPLNYLSSNQLEIQIEGLPIRDWIQQGQGRGRLTPIIQEIVAWELDEEEQKRVRPVLDKHRVLFNWRDWL